MDTTTLKRFAQSARTSLYDQVKVRLRAILNEASLERRDSPDAVKALSDDIAKHGEDVMSGYGGGGNREYTAGGSGAVVVVYG